MHLYRYLTKMGIVLLLKLAPRIQTDVLGLHVLRTGRRWRQVRGQWTGRCLGRGSAWRCRLQWLASLPGPLLRAKPTTTRRRWHPGSSDAWSSAYVCFLSIQPLPRTYAADSGPWIRPAWPHWTREPQGLDQDWWGEGAQGLRKPLRFREGVAGVPAHPAQ